jgi:hypothetical protein
MQAIRTLEAAGRSQPIATPGAEFSDPEVYSRMTYTKPALVLRMLRGLVGEDAMRAILQEFFRRHALTHVDEGDFRSVVRDVTGTDYGWFFDQWLHTTATLDYSIASAGSERGADGRWRTRVTIRREGEAWMPVTIQVGAERRELTGPGREQVAEFITAGRPTEVVVDPEGLILDVEPANNRLDVEQ